MQFYLSYRQQGMTPPEIAVQGLQRALELAPYDPQLRWMNANQYMADGKYAWAALANSPHPSSLSEAAQTLMKEAEAKAAVTATAKQGED